MTVNMSEIKRCLSKRKIKSGFRSIAVFSLAMKQMSFLDEQEEGEVEGKKYRWEEGIEREMESDLF